MKIVPGKLQLVFMTLLVLLLLCFSSIKLVSAESLQQGQIGMTPLLNQPDELDPTPEPQIPVIPREEAEAFIPVMSQTSDPRSRPVLDQQYNVQALLQTPEVYDGYQIQLQGKILRIQSLSSIRLSGWKDGFVLTFNDGTASIPVLYRGSLYQLENGTNLNLSGVFVADGMAIYADYLQPEVQPQAAWLGLPQGMLVIAISLLALGLVAVILLIIPLRSKTVLSVVLILLGLGLSACEIHMQTEVKPDGRVITSIQLQEKTEDVDFLRKIPGLDGYIQSMMAQMRLSSSQIENWVADEQEYFFIQHEYPDIQTFQQRSEEPNPEQASWVYLHAYPLGNETCYRFQGLISPEIFYEIPEATDWTVLNAVGDLVDDIEMTYSLILPGRLIYSNAESTNANRSEWDVDMREQNTLIAESCYVNQAMSGIDWRWGWLAIGGGALVVIALWLFVVQKMIRHKNNTRANREVAA